jgi:glycosyltransferase involved in cell wall biosynthesis
MNKNPINIGLLYTGGRAWIGGEHYILNILSSLKEFARAQQEGDVQYRVVLCYESEEVSDHVREIFKDADDFQRIQTHKSALRRRDVFIPVLNLYLPRKLRLFKARQQTLFFDCEGIDFLYPYDFRGALPAMTHAVAWIADFQPRKYPQFFGEANLKWRYEYEQNISDSASDIIFSSEDCIADFRKYFPASKARPHLFRFHPSIHPQTWQQDPLPIQRLYHLPDKYLICSNQFWQHKNHQAILEAIAKLQSQIPDLFVVFTGHTQDDRLAEHFDNLCTIINCLGVRDRIAILGLIPRHHQLQLLRRSIGVIQPSLSEGWSSIVEDIRSLGKSSILSDLPVHQEQNPPQAIYYDRNSSDALRLAMAQAWDLWKPGPDLVKEQDARLISRDLLLKMGENFIQIVEDVMAINNNGAVLR